MLNGILNPKKIRLNIEWVFILAVASYAISIMIFGNSLINNILTLLLEIFFDIVCAIYCIKNSSIIKYKKLTFHFFILAFGFIALIISDFYFNLMVGIYKSVPAPHMLDPINLPLLTFLVCQLFFWSKLLVDSKIKRNRKLIVLDLPIILMGITIFSIFLYAFFRSDHLSMVQQFYQYSSVTVEMLSFVIVIVCLMTTFNQQISLMATGYLMIIATDFLLRFSFLQHSLINDYMLQILWIGGQAIFTLGLAKLIPNPKNPNTWFGSLYSIQVQCSIWTYTTCSIALFCFLTANYFFSFKSLYHTSVIFNNLPSLLIIFSVFSVILSRLLANKLLQPFSVIKNGISHFSQEQITDFPIQPTIKQEIDEFRELNQFIIDAFNTLKDKYKTEKELLNNALQVTHDIKSPTSAIFMLAQNCPELPEQQRTILREAGTRILDIANNLLTKYRKSLANHSLHQKTYIKELLVPAAITSVIAEKKAQLTNSMIELKADFHDGSNLAFIKFDPVEFKRILSNLINNAIEAMNGSGEVTLRICTTNENVKISICDTGCGISEDTIHRIYSGQDLISDKKDGHGLGLRHAYNAVIQHNGQFLIQSNREVGTNITFVFPKCPSPSWLLDYMKLKPNEIVHILDEDFYGHEAWEKRFKPYSQIKIENYYAMEDYINHIESLNEDEKNQIFLLASCKSTEVFEILNILANSKIKKITLITDSYDNKTIVDTASSLGIKILPQILVPEIPITISNLHSANTIQNIIVLDDNKEFTFMLDYVASNESIHYFNDPYEFLEVIFKYPKNTKIYLDYDLNSNINGLDIAKILYEKGYANICLMSGYDFDYQQLPAYIKVINKMDIANVKFN